MSTMEKEEQLGSDLMSQMIGAGLREAATDIHLEPLRDEVAVRFRYPDGMREVGRHSLELGGIARRQLKKWCQADLDVEDLPQDGRLLFETDQGERVFARVSTFPTVYGERLVVRLQSRLPEQWSGGGIEQCELAPEQKQKVMELAGLSTGLVLLASPLGASELAYPWLATLVDNGGGRRNIVSLESPVASFVEGVAQTEVRTRQDQMGYAYVLRAVSRQDPDVVCCGAVPDGETARELLRLSLSGTLVLAQMRASDAATALSLWTSYGLEMGELAQLSSVLKGVVAERTVRRLCGCQGTGCPNCRQTGFLGRISVLQIQRWQESDSLSPHTSAADLRARLAIDWKDSAEQVVRAGLTTAEESRRATA